MPFKKGDDPRRNAKGRPPLVQIPDLLRRIGNQDAKDGGTKLEALMGMIFDKALDGTQWAAILVIERLDGRPRQQIDLNTSDRDDFNQLSDDLLATIAAQGLRSGEDTAAKTESPPQPT